MKKKLFALLLATLLLAGCTTSTSKKKRKKSTSEEIVNVVTNVTLNRSEINFNLNEEHQYVVETLVATVEGEGDYDKTLTWSSSNESVATVVNGVINGLSIGNAVITATSNSNKDKYATCSISVINDIPVVESVSISPEQPTIDLKTSSSVQLTAIVSGKNSPSQKVTWQAQSSGVLSVNSDGLVTATQTGSGTISATSVEDTSKFATVSVTVIDSTPRVNSVEIQPNGSSYSLDLYEEKNNKTKQFSAKVNAEYGASEEVTWSSSDPSKVSVSEAGLVTALQTTVSSVTITATSKFDSTKTDTVLISVVDTTPRVSSVNVSLAQSVKVNGTTTASAVVSGTNISADQKKVTWSSSNSSIADVDPNTGVVTGKSVGGPVTITATSVFDNTKYGSATISVQEASTGDAYTVMIYMCGSDLESDGDYASTDISEILAVTQSQPEDVNIIIETGGASRWASTHGISANYLTRYEVRDRKLVKKAQLTKANMSISSTFQSFVEWGIKDYPADKMALVFWDHGSGLDGCCYDENYSSYPSYDYLDPIEVQTGFRNAFKNTNYNDRFEWIGYDCCLMQNLELAAINAEFAQYMVASQVSENGGGWDYTPWVTELYKNKEGQTSTLLTKICDSFVDYYSSSSNQTLSWVYLDRVATFTSAFDSFVKTSGKTYSTYKSAANNALCFERDTCSYDLGGILNYSSLSVTSEVKSAYSNIVGYTRYNTSYYRSKQPTGVNFFVGNYTDEDTYEAITKDTLPNWSAMVLANW